MKNTTIAYIASVWLIIGGIVLGFVNGWFFTLVLAGIGAIITAKILEEDSGRNHYY